MDSEAQYAVLKEAPDTVEVLAAAPPTADVIEGRGDASWVALFEPYEGLLVREKLFWSQVCCALCEKKLRFNAGPWNSSMPARLQEEHFSILRTQHLFELREESTCFCRYCCHQHREAQLGIFAPNQDVGAGGGFQGFAPFLTVHRPFK